MPSGFLLPIAIVLIILIASFAAFLTIRGRERISGNGSQSSSTSNSLAAPGKCATSVGSLPFAFVISAKQGSPAVICTRVYYYNLTSGLGLDASQLVRITGEKTYSNGTTIAFAASPNFTVTADPATATIGGPANESEGIQVNFLLTPHESAHGRYGLSFGWLLPSERQCALEFVLIAGSGSPDYTYPASCQQLTGNVGAFPYPQGYLFVLVTGVTNST